MQRTTPPTLPLYLAAAYTLLVIYASLHPFFGWRDSGAPISAFLFAAWPRYWTRFDFVTNALAYIPLGFFWVPALKPRYGIVAAASMAAVLGACLSLSVETLQNFLPSRVPSNLDFASNSAGALLGALAGVRWGAELLDGGALHSLRTRLIGEGKMADAGLLLLALWLLTQLNPGILLFGNGDLRDLLGLFGLAAPLPYDANHFSWLEAGVTATNTLTLGLLLGCLLRTKQRLMVMAVLSLALLIKSFSLSLLMNGSSSLAWATPGNVAGLIAGTALWLVASFLPGGARRILAALSLLLGTTLVNLAPENPYLAAILQVWQQGHFLNFNGVTRLASALWPFVALPWLMLLRQEGERR